MPLRVGFFLFFLLSFVPLGAQPDSSYEPTAGRWRLRNSRIEATFRLNAQTGAFGFELLRDLRSGRFWRPPANVTTLPLHVVFDDGTALGPRSEFALREQAVTALPGNGLRQTIELQDARTLFIVRFEFDIYEDHPVVRSRAAIRNGSLERLHVVELDLIPLDFADEGERFETFHVNQWVLYPRAANFDPQANALSTDGTPVLLETGSGATDAAWLAIRDRQQRGLFMGLEFNGRASFTVRHTGPDRAVYLSAAVPGIYHAIAPGEEMALPAVFLGSFQGDWDEAAWQTQRFVDAALTPPVPEKFPYVVWDSWGFTQNIDEDLLRRNAAIAARLGMELFIVDLGWARSIGDWRPDPAKFPQGLRPLSDYVHSLGMKFGLHFAFPEADPLAPVLREHPEWRSSQSYNYIGADSLCIGHRPVRDWIIQQGVRIVREYNVDWILQDGQTVVKHCEHTGHTHHRADSNWTNSEEGLDVILAEIQRQCPWVVWENCANGGSTMTFKMARQYATSISNDASGALGSRQGAYGVTYPFPPRYSDRYMPEEQLDGYVTRSSMFGGPWIFMNRLTEMAPEDLAFAAKEIQTYKQLRGIGNGGKVARLTARPAAGRTDAIQTYNPALDRAMAVVARDHAPEGTFQLRLRDLRPAGNYRVTFQDDRRVLTMTGAQLMSAGVVVTLAAPQSAEIVVADPVP